MLISVDIFHCDKKTNHFPLLDLCSTCHAVLNTVEVFKGLTRLAGALTRLAGALTRLAGLTRKLRFHVPRWLKNA